MLQDKNTAQNLCAQVLKEFPWYDDLVIILRGNPALSLKTVSSHPGMDHTANFFSISHSAGSSYSNGPNSGSAQYGYAPGTLPPSGAYPPAGDYYPPSSAHSPSGAHHPPGDYSPSGTHPPPRNYSPSGTHPPSGTRPPHSKAPPYFTQTGSQYGFGHVPQPYQMGYREEYMQQPQFQSHSMPSPSDFLLDKDEDMPDYFGPLNDDEGMDFSFGDLWPHNSPMMHDY
ncbi:hypothetical protein DFJ58DRAFT_729148 [Suillus subalutaceus]|uniref:uncharacterized protein n=1 Tax=Suillus subalutaceus TaxID=48586 RepID=UPI001B86D8AB|nr:uncharacterized protein DFJ58DRAFT_729148 [Suillus subalutaceus]KAG1850856.1 hypothetical protein DFJ58DRAFT_729148 [Suillus subalutaceus]